MKGFWVVPVVVSILILGVFTVIPFASADHLLFFEQVDDKACTINSFEDKTSILIHPETNGLVPGTVSIFETSSGWFTTSAPFAPLGPAIAIWTIDGLGEITFVEPVSSISFSYSSDSEVTLDAFDSSGNLVGSISASPNNAVTPPWRFWSPLSLDLESNIISKITITGANFLDVGIDEFTYCIGPPGIVISEDLNDNLEVGPDDNIILDGATINGNVEVNGGEFAIRNGGTVTGNIEASNGASVTIDNGSIDGNVKLEDGSTAEITDSVIDGNIESKDSDITASGNTVDGNIKVENTTSCLVFDNEVDGNLELDENCETAPPSTVTIIFQDSNTDRIPNALCRVDDSSGGFIFTNQGFTNEDGQVTLFVDPIFTAIFVTCTQDGFVTFGAACVSPFSGPMTVVLTEGDRIPSINPCSGSV